MCKVYVFTAFTLVVFPKLKKLYLCLSCYVFLHFPQAYERGMCLLSIHSIDIFIFPKYLILNFIKIKLI